MALLRILLVEDDPDDIDLMQEALRDRQIHFMMDTVRHGDQVVSHLNMCTNLPNIIILDLNLPKMHGREVLTSIKSNDRYKHIPVTILTTSSSPDDRAHCLHAGADRFLTKPATVEGFNHTVAVILDVASQGV